MRRARLSGCGFRFGLSAQAQLEVALLLELGANLLVSVNAYPSTTACSPETGRLGSCSGAAARPAGGRVMGRSATSPSCRACSPPFSPARAGRPGPCPGAVARPVGGRVVVRSSASPSCRACSPRSRQPGLDGPALVLERSPARRGAGWWYEARLRLRAGRVPPRSRRLLLPAASSCGQSHQPKSPAQVHFLPLAMYSSVAAPPGVLRASWPGAPWQRSRKWCCAAQLRPWPQFHIHGGPLLAHCR